MYTRAQRKVVAEVSVPASRRSRLETSKLSMLNPASGSSFSYRKYSHFKAALKEDILKLPSPILTQIVSMLLLTAKI